MKNKYQSTIDILENAIKSNEEAIIRRAIWDTGLVDFLNNFIYKEKDAPLFRVRPCPSGDDYPYNKIENFSYPPSPKRGRCNIDGQPVLYTSLESRTAVLEMIREEQEGSNIWLSIWKPEKEIKCFVFVFDSTLIEDSFTKSLNNEIISELVTRKDFKEYLPLYKWVSGKFMGDEHTFSSILCDELFSLLDIDGIIYPSYAGKRWGLNLVLKKEFADNSLDLLDIRQLKVHEWDFPKSVKYLYLGEARIERSGKLAWIKESYDEEGLYITEQRLREERSKGSKVVFNHSFRRL